MDQTSIRGEIIRKFISIEMSLELIISLHYLGKFERKFIFEVLKDDYFSFGLKRRIFEKFFNKKKSYPGFISDLNRLNNIRNIFAHRITFLKGPSIQESEEQLLDPYSMKGLDIQELYKEFLQKFDKVSPELIKISKELGANWV